MVELDAMANWDTDNHPNRHRNCDTNSDTHEHADHSRFTTKGSATPMNWHHFWHEVVKWFTHHHHKHRMAYITVKFEIAKGGD